MRNPDNLIRVDYKSGDEIIPISLHEYDIDDYDLFNEKDYKKFIADIEKMCRGSREYKKMVNYLKDNVDMDNCAFLKNVSNSESTRIKIHIHHEPFTLYDICTIVYNKRRKRNECIDIEDISKEVMYIHYMNYVGLIPLSETPHELVHNGYLFIPMESVYGKFKTFVEIYEPYMDQEHLDCLKSIIHESKYYNGEDSKLLEKNYIYLDIDDQEDYLKRFKKMKQLTNKVKDSFNSNNNSYIENIAVVPYEIKNKGGLSNERN